MARVKTDLDKIQSDLHDDGTIWSRALLLRYYNDGYRQLLARSQGVKRFFDFDVPGRTSGAGTYEWEDRHVSGTFRRFSRPAARQGWFSSLLWEVEHLLGVTPTDSTAGVTHLWERTVSGDIDQHFRFYLPKSTEQILRVTHDGRRLGGTSTKEKDLQGNRWWKQGGEPQSFLPGVGRDQTFEIFTVVTDYLQAYIFIDADKGGAREIYGTRTYTTTSSVHHPNNYAYTTLGDGDALENGSDMPVFGAGDADISGLGVRVTYKPTLASDGLGINVWEREQIDGETPSTTGVIQGTYWWEGEFTGVTGLTPALGAMRQILSPDRQYPPQAYLTGETQNLGLPKDFKSNKDSVSVLMAIVPTRDLTEDDDPALIPPQLSKYLRYYAKSMAFAKTGEGQRPDMAKHFMERFDRGVRFFKKISDLTSRSHVYQRQEAAPSSSRPPRVRLPSTFQRYW